MGLTTNFGLKTIGPGESISDDNYQFSLADRELLDSLLQATLDHHHDGSNSDDLEQPPAPTVEPIEGDGVLDADYTYEYKIAWVDEYGRESQASEATSFTTAEVLDTPGKPSLQFLSNAGTLSSGTYAYVVAAYDTDTYTETRASMATAVTLPRGNTHAIELSIPEYGDDAPSFTGFNIYRRRPGGLDFYYIGSSDDYTFTDDGLPDDCNRFAPEDATLGTDNVLRISIPEVPEGYTWKIYRSVAPGMWENSFVHHVVERTSEDPDAPLLTEYIDVGEAGLPGAPNDYGSFTFYNPQKVLLTDGAEVQGILPASMVEGGGGDGGSAVRPPTPALDGLQELMPEESSNTYLGIASSEPAYVMVPVDLDAVDGTVWHFTAVSPVGLGVWPATGVTVDSVTGDRGVALYGEARLWKEGSNNYILSGDLIPIDPPPALDYYSQLAAYETSHVWPLGSDTSEASMEDIGYIGGADGVYVDAADNPSTAIVFEQEGPQPWLPSVEITAEGDRGRVATSSSMSGEIAFSVAGWWRPDSTPSDGSEPIFRFTANDPIGTGTYRVSVFAMDGGSPYFSGYHVALQEWNEGKNPDVDAPDRDYGFNAYSTSPQPAGEWVFWAASFEVPDGSASSVINFWLDGVLQDGNEGGDNFSTTDLGTDISVDVAIATSGVPDRFAGVTITPGVWTDNMVLAMYEAASVAPEGWEPPVEP